MEHTNLGAVAVRDRVNLECDMVGKYVSRRAAGELASEPVTAMTRRLAGRDIRSTAIERSQHFEIAKGAREATSPVRAASKTRSKPFAPATMIIVVDDEDRENEGDLTIAAEKVTPEAINFMATLRPRAGLPVDDAGAARRARDPADGRAEHLARSRPAFCVSIEAQGTDEHRHLRGRSRGDGARRRSIRRRGRPISRGPATCFRCARATGGVMVRAGQTEAAVDLARIAGPVSGRRHLRNHERGRHDGPRAASWRSSRSGTGC